MYNAYVIVCFVVEIIGTLTKTTVLLEHLAGEKPLRMSQISRKFDSLQCLRSEKDHVYLFTLEFSELID